MSKSAPISTRREHLPKAGCGAPSARTIVLRTIAATLGAYLIAALAAGVLARLLPLRPTEAVTTGTLASLLVFPLVALYAFASPNLARLGATLGGVAIVLSVLLGVSYMVAAP